MARCQIAPILSHNLYQGAKGFKIAQQPIQDGMDGVLVACKTGAFIWYVFFGIETFFKNEMYQCIYIIYIYIYICSS